MNSLCELQRLETTSCGDLLNSNWWIIIKVPEQSVEQMVPYGFAYNVPMETAVTELLLFMGVRFIFPESLILCVRWCCCWLSKTFVVLWLKPLSSDIIETGFMQMM